MLGGCVGLLLVFLIVLRLLTWVAVMQMFTVETGVANV